MIERRSGDASVGDRCFVRWLSLTLVIVSSIGAMIVLIDPVITFAVSDGSTIKIGGTGFSDQLKGAVVSLILVSGFAAVIAYWLGASNQGQRAQEQVGTIATTAAPMQAAAVAAARSEPVAPVKTESLTVDAAGADININQDDRKT